MLDGVAQHGKGIMGWSFGFKLQLIINHLGKIVSLKLTKENIDDRNPVAEMADSILENFMEIKEISVKFYLGSC